MGPLRRESTSVALSARRAHPGFELLEPSGNDDEIRRLAVLVVQRYDEALAVRGHVEGKKIGHAEQGLGWPDREGFQRDWNRNHGVAAAVYQFASTRGPPRLAAAARGRLPLRPRGICLHINFL